MQQQSRQGRQEQTEPVGIDYRKAQKWGELGFPEDNASSLRHAMHMQVAALTHMQGLWHSRDHPRAASLLQRTVCTRGLQQQPSQEQLL